MIKRNDAPPQNQNVNTAPHFPSKKIQIPSPPKKYLTKIQNVTKTEQKPQNLAFIGKNINNDRTGILRVQDVLEEPYSSVFDFEYFNQIQSACFDASMNKDFNLLVSAPTGKKY